MVGSDGRMLDDWLSAYLEMTDIGEPPVQFDLWCGISVLAACLERRCYTMWEYPIYANLYVIIIGPAGCRKGTAMYPARKLLKELGVNIGASSLTREALIKKLEDIAYTSIDPETGTINSHSSLTIFSPELAVLLGTENAGIMKALTDWFDCADDWDYETKNKGINKIQNLWVNMMGATTPALLQSVLPQDAIGGGLTSRIVFVYGDKKKRIAVLPILGKKEKDLYLKLKNDLEMIKTLSGEFRMTEDFLNLYTEWYIHHSNSTAIEDYHFAPYLERRQVHLRKLAMIMSVARSQDMILNGNDFERARSVLVAAEEHMPKVFSGYGKSDVAELYPRLMGLISRLKITTRNDLLKHFYRDIDVTMLDKMLLALKNTEFCSLIREGDTIFVKYLDKPKKEGT